MQASNEKEHNCTSQIQQRCGNVSGIRAQAGTEICVLVFKATQEMTLKGLKRKLVTLSTDW